MSDSKTIVSSKYVPKYTSDYFKKLWYEKDFMEYFDYCDYQDMTKDPIKNSEIKKVINFEIIHQECRGDPLNGSYKDYKTIYDADIKEYPELEKKKRFWEVFFVMLTERIRG